MAPWRPITEIIAAKSASGELIFAQWLSISHGNAYHFYAVFVGNKGMLYVWIYDMIFIK